MGKKIVVAIDIGDIYTRCAISIAGEKKPEVLTVAFKSSFHQPSPKVTTSLLLNERGEFEAFGYDADIKFKSLMKNGTHHDWFYFQRFRLQLRRSAMSETIKTYDGKKELPIVFVFSLVIRYLSCLISNFENDIYWILTIPDDWNTTLESLFEEACLQAGLQRENFLLVTESVANSSFCDYTLGHYPGERLLLINCGTRQIFKDYPLQSHFIEHLGIFDGSPIDKAIRDLFLEIAGKDIFMDDRVSYEERTGKLKDIQLKLWKADTLIFALHPLWIKDITKVISGTRFNKSTHIELISDKLVISSETIMSIFKTAICSEILNCSENAEEQEEKNRLSGLFFTGDFSEIAMIQTIFENKLQVFSTRSYSSSLSVVKGAAVLGHVPKLISSLEYEFVLKVNEANKIKVDQDKGDNRSSSIWKLIGNAKHTHIQTQQNVEQSDTDIVTNNPEIVLLSNSEDQITLCTQLKIVNALKTLYEREWIYGYKILLEKGLGKPKCVSSLLSILIEAEEACQIYMKTQCKHMAKIFDPTLNEVELVENNSKYLTGQCLDLIWTYRRTYEGEHINKIIEIFPTTSKINLTRTHIDSCSTYFRKCIEICWRMLCQHPPMFMDYSVKRKSPIDQSLYNLYTKTGDMVDFLVWPIIYSSKGGDVLFKGVVEAL